jgi:hypothetical protein
MNAINRESILNKTHYGLGIYSHILHLYYPNEVVLRLVERDCSLCRNPFNDNKETLHIFIQKENVLGNAFDKELAHHEDSENAIPAGDAFDFAELHYKQQGDELLTTLNKELNLRLGEKQSFYANNPVNHKNSINQGSDILFSFFKALINNVKPHSESTFRKVYNEIVGNSYKECTEKLRAISDVSQARKFKASNFDYCTFSGVFTPRNDKALIKHSGLLCIDLDHLNSIETLFNRLLNDAYFDTQLLFHSPSGNGLKWIISIDTATTTHSDYFVAVDNYILQPTALRLTNQAKIFQEPAFYPTTRRRL